MKPNARHDLRHPIAAIFLIASTADAFGEDFGPEMLARCRDEMTQELDRFRALAQHHDVDVDVSELAATVAAFARDPSCVARALAVQQACQSVLFRIGPPNDGQPIELGLEGPDAVEV